MGKSWCSFCYDCEKLKKKKKKKKRTIKGENPGCRFFFLINKNVHCGVFLLSLQQMIKGWMTTL